MSNDTIREALTLPPEAGSWLLKAWGETEWPAVLIATSEAQVRAFIVAEWLGDARDLDNVMDDIIGHDFKDDGPWVAEFEIGGLSIEPAYESAAAERALSQAPQAAQPEPVAYLKEWDSVGHARTGLRRVDLTPDCEPWLANMCPKITPLHAAPQAPAAQPQDARISELETICAQLYQVLGILADEAGRFDDPHLIKAMDNAAAQKLVHDDVIPFPSAPAAQPAIPTDRLEQIIDEYIANYEFRGDGGDYAPNERERFLMKDAFMGLLADDDWDAEWGKHIAALAAAQRSGESAQAESDALFGFRRDDLQDIADGLDAYERTVNVGNVTGDGDELVESTTAAAARFIRAALKQQQEKQG